MTLADALSARLAEQLADRYELLRELGGGGMSRVFLVEERALRRRVVLKLLPPELAGALSVERFRREIVVAAQLQHPHIVPVLAAGEVDGLLYYTMPFVEGDSLRARLERDGTLPISLAVRIARDVAGALEHAHRRGVVHRDVKPENVLLTDDHALVVDFGIARALDAASGPTDGGLTATGLVIGTAAYMSPEQASGDRDIDGRSDVYSLACVLYEAIAGRPPFEGPSIQAVIVRRFLEPPPSLGELGAAVPAALDAAVRRAMATEPSERFASAAEFAAALGDSAAGVSTARASAEPGDSIVVLPFDNVSPDPDTEYFSDGLTDEVIADLSQVRALRVISRNSSMRLKGTTLDTRSIGRQLGVRWVLQGTVRRAGSALRVTAQLNDAGTDTTVWAQKYGGTLEDVFEIQERLAREIVAALRVTLSGDEANRVGVRQVRDPVAYDCYLRARQHVHSGAPERFALARELLGRATEIVGENPLILAAQAHERFFAMMSGLESDPAIYAQALALAERAVSLDPRSAEAHAIVGLVHKALGNVVPASEALRRALALEGNHVDALMTLAWVAADAGHPHAARELLGRAASASPFEPMLSLFEAVAALFDGRYEQALRHAEAFQRSDPDSPFGGGFRMLALGFLGRLDEQRAACRALAQRFAGRVDLEAIVRLALGRLDRVVPLLSVLEPAHLAHARTDGEIAWWAAHCLAANGEPDAAVEWLRTAIGLGFMNYPFLTRQDPAIAPLQGHPAFDALMADLQPRWRALEF